MSPNFIQRFFARARRGDASAPARAEVRSRTREARPHLDESQNWLPLGLATAEVREVNSLEEEVEAFLLMERPDMAVALVRNRLEDHAGMTAHLWCRILDHLRGRGLRSEFEQCALEMKAVFNVELASWHTPALVVSSLPGLETVPHVLEKVVRHWNNPGCLGYLRGLTRDIRDGNRAGFRQEAFRDMVMLIGVLERKRRLGTSV